MRKASNCSKQKGLSLVELMVALVIGMLTTLVIMQVFSAFEGQKRATIGSADAQTNGSIALHSIVRDLQIAGFGLLATNNANPYLCDPMPTVDHDNNAATAAIPMIPVSITDGGNAAGSSDTLSLSFGNTLFGGSPNIVSASTGGRVTISSNLGCQVNDIALLINGNVCATTRVTDLGNPVDNTSVGLASLAAVSVGNSFLSCLGAWTNTVYRVNNGNLEANGTPIVTGIVALRAQYGISATANDNQINAWVSASAAPWNAAPLAIADRNRIKAVRIAVIARTDLYEREVVSSACSSTTINNPAPTGVCAWAGSAASPAPTIDLSNTADWDHYRYRVFETIIPLRNVIWARSLL